VSRTPKRSASPIGDPLTEAEVWEMLCEARVPGAKQLSREAVSLLTKGLNADQGQYLIDQLLDPVNAAKRKVIALLEEAQGVLDKLAEHERQFLACAQAVAAANPKHHVYESSAEAKRGSLAEIAEIDRLLTEVSKSPALEERRNTTGKWQESGLYWFDSLNDTLATIGKTVGIGTGIDPNGKTIVGPYGQFVAALVKRLTGERTTPQSVVTQMKKARQNRQKTVIEEEPPEDEPCEVIIDPDDLVT
jgi:hypothetical protein